MTINWQWNSLYCWFWCQFVQNFNRNILGLNLTSFLSIWEKISCKTLPLPLVFSGACENYFFSYKKFKLKNSREYGILNMNLLWSVPLLITSSYSFWLQIPQFQVWIFFTGYFYSKLSIFGRKVYVQCYGENFEVHNFVFLISDLVSMYNFILEKVFF